MGDLETNRSQEFQNLLFLSNAWQAEVIARRGISLWTGLSRGRSDRRNSPQNWRQSWERMFYESNESMSHESWVMSQWVNESDLKKKIKLGITFILFCLLASLLPEHARPIYILPRHPWRTDLNHQTIHTTRGSIPEVKCCQKVVDISPGGEGTPIHYLYGYVPPNGVVILKLLI